MMQSFHNIRSAKPQPYEMIEALLSRPKVKDTYLTCSCDDSAMC